MVDVGDVVLVLDDTIPRADLEVLRSQQVQLIAIEARLSAEFDGKEAIDFPPALLDAGDTVAAAAVALASGEAR